MKKCLAAILMLLTGLAMPAAAQEWPSKLVTLVVPFAPGSTTDTLARVLGQKLQAKFDQPVVVLNRPGAGGNIGTDLVAKAAPDGYTLGLSILGPLVLNTAIFPSMPYNPDKDIVPVTLLITQPALLVALPSLKAETARDLFNLIKAAPDKYSYASPGQGSLAHLAMEAIIRHEGLKIVHVPYAGPPGAVNALLSGDVQVALLPAPSVVPLANQGKLKLLSATSARRSPFLPNIPTLSESGIPDIDADAWIGLIAPAGTPALIIATIHKEIAEIYSDPEIAKKMAVQYQTPIANGPDEFRRVIERDRKTWLPIVRDANITAN